MRIAICFYGLVGSISDKNGKGISLDPKIAYEYYKKNIFDKNDKVDVFIHSYSVESKKDLIKLYNPQNYIIENQVLFPQAKRHPFINKGIVSKIKMFFLRIFKKKSYLSMMDYYNKESFRAHSRWYSVKSSVKLMRDHEIKNNFKYDCVMSTRLDVSFFKPIVFSDYDMSFFYASNWNDAYNLKNKSKANFKNHNVGKGFLDFWFFSNSNLIYQYSKLFDFINKYPVSPHTSSYQHVSSFTSKIKYTLYRWYDHEMIRRKFYESEK